MKTSEQKKKQESLAYKKDQNWTKKKEQRSRKCTQIKENYLKKAKRENEQ